MPLPKLPTKPAALLSVQDYPKAEAGKAVKPRIAVVEPITRNKEIAPQARDKSVAKPAVKPVESRKTKTPAENVRAVADKPAKPAEGHSRPKSSTSRAADKSGVTKLFVLDTNVLMHDPSSLFRFEEHDIYLPMVTLEELDNHKKGMSEVARNARQVSRSLDALVGDIGDDQIDHGIPLSKLGNKDAKGRLFFQTKLQNADLPEGLPVGKADNQILGVVRGLEAETPGRPVVLVSKDINMRIKARAMGLPAEDYFNDHVLEDTDLLYSGIQQLPDDFWIKHGKGIESWQENKHGTGYTYYRLSGPLVPTLLVNQFVFIEPKNGEPAFYGQVTQINGKTAVLQTLRDYGHAKNSVWGITARNREQNFALNLLMNPDCDFVTLLGQAGTGKTLLALAAGLAQVLETKTYNEIIVTRVTVPVGEDIGFLPGTEEEKMGPWMGAFDDNLEVLNKSDSDAGEWGRAATQDLIRSRIKIKSLNFMRGRTFVNKFLIIDEAQNLTPKQMKTLVTRAGPGTKIICLGNIAQIDTPYLTEGSSGLTYVVDRFKGWSHSGHVTLARGERSRLADHASDVL
ncbi:PhoH-like ATPase [Collimonas sp. PA-H2]|uniref:PhoH family protein n=1 Tax=Collimonas sp. PA-H2 TaxID=1881062 RepID=UPI000BF41C7B|nr:PhoH family protein [Collimonas sp. PA-H2]PFH12035.1 PhoH-like ATPase [Collimonas sp. PA-H2]